MNAQLVQMVTELRADLTPAQRLALRKTKINLKELSAKYSNKADLTNAILNAQIHAIQLVKGAN